MIAVLACAALVELQGPGGQTIWLSPQHVISVREPRGTTQGHWPAGTRCLVMTTDGRFLTTTESCGVVRQKLSAPQ